MKYHSPEFQNIADKAAAFARPLILQTIQELATDFIKELPTVYRIDCTHGDIKFYFKSDIKELHKADAHPLRRFLEDVIKKDLIGFCPDITLQPVLMIDGVPIDEAIHNAQQTIFVVQSHNYRNWDGSESDQPHTQTHYVGTDEATAHKYLQPCEDGILWNLAKWNNDTELFFNS